MAGLAPLIPLVGARGRRVVSASLPLSASLPPDSLTTCLLLTVRAISSGWPVLGPR